MSKNIQQPFSMYISHEDIATKSRSSV